MPTKTNEFFKFLIIIQILFGVFITGTLYFLPGAVGNNLENFAAFWDQDTAEEMESMSEDSIESIEEKEPALGSMFIVFRTGFILVDLLLNSLLALPQMISIVLAGLFLLAPINPWIIAVVQTMVFSIVSMVYIWMVISFLFSAITGRVI